MANVSEERLRDSASKEFKESLLQKTGLYRALYFKAAMNDALANPHPQDVAYLIESSGWYEVGAQIGYFDSKFQMDDDIWDFLREQLLSHDRWQWPSQFFEIGTRFSSKDRQVPFIEGIPYGEQAALSFFQAVTVAREDLDGDLLACLLTELRLKEHSVLDEDVKRDLDSQRVFDALTRKKPRDRTLETLAAGLVQLIEVLQTFSDLTKAGENFPGSSMKTRWILSQYLGSLLGWRLDIGSAEVRLRIATIFTYFLRLAEILRNHNSSGFHWSNDSAESQFNELLVRWAIIAFPGEMQRAPLEARDIRKVRTTDASVTKEVDGGDDENEKLFKSS